MYNLDIFKQTLKNHILSLRSQYDYLHQHKSDAVREHRYDPNVEQYLLHNGSIYSDGRLICAEIIKDLESLACYQSTLDITNPTSLSKLCETIKGDINSIQTAINKAKQIDKSYKSYAYYQEFHITANEIITILNKTYQDIEFHIKQLIKTPQQMHIEFKNKLLRCDGTSFQSIINQLLLTIYPNSEYIPVEPSGAWGDGGNDGYVPNQGRYFQIYSPKTLKENISKVGDDIDKLLKKWPNIKIYTFINNTRHLGFDALTANKIEKEIKVRFPKIEFNLWSSLQVMKIFDDLSDDQQQKVLSKI